MYESCRNPNAALDSHTLGQGQISPPTAPIHAVHAGPWDLKTKVSFRDNDLRNRSKEREASEAEEKEETTQCHDIVEINHLWCGS